MAHDEAFIWDRPTPPLRPKRSSDQAGLPEPNRISLRDAERQFGVRVATLRTWARNGSIDAIHGAGNAWMVTPESVAHHLSRNKPAVAERRARPAGAPPDGSSMLVPRDAWDKLLDQLGNLHEAGLRLAEARERAARAETEASFLRERLAELRAERDSLRAESPGASAATTRRVGWWSRVLRHPPAD